MKEPFSIQSRFNSQLKRFACILLLFLPAIPGFSQSAIQVRNNSWLEMEVLVQQTGSHTLDPSEWSHPTAQIIPWAYDQDVLTVDRDSNAIPLGDSIFLTVQLIANGDTAHLNLRLDGTPGGSSLEYAGSLPTIADSWWDDGGFHEIQGAFGGKDIILKYHPANGDGNMDRRILFVVHQKPEYELNPADASDPNTLNVISYNVQFLPFFIGGFDNFTRAPLIPPRMDPDLDVVVFEEAFDPLPRTQFLIPAMQAQGFVHRTDILNDYLPFNGGVIIFSRWPIEATDEYDYQLCGPNSGDCFANKGILYAKVNKMGKRYHMFGTHMDAGSDVDDLLAKNLQFAEMRDFIAAQNIPPHEPAIFSGDFNVRPTAISLFNNMLDSLNPLLPDYQGYWSSTMSTDTGALIDHAWIDRRSLIPLTATNEIITLRGLEEDMWDISDYSDHRTNWGRFTFPDIAFEPVDTSMCPGDAITFSVTASGVAFSYQWFQDSIAISGETSPNLVLTNLQLSDAGNYSCTVSYTTIHGTKTDPVNLLFYPNGPDTVLAELPLQGWRIDVDPIAIGCGVAAKPMVAGSVNVYPNPISIGSASDRVRVELIDLPPKGQLRLWDVNGRLVLEQELRSGMVDLDVSELASGVFVLEVAVGDRRLRKRLLVR